MRSLLLDTNTLLDIAVAQRPGAQAAQQIFDAIADHKVIGYIFLGSLKDFYYIARKGMNDELRREWISLFLDAFLLAAFDRETCKAALTSDEPDFEDGLVRAAAEHERCDCIVSRDEAAFTASPVERLSPEDCVSRMQL